MTGWQKASYPLVGAVVLMALVPGFIAAGEARLELTVVVRGGAFVPSTIVLPGYGTVLNLTVRNEDATLAPAPTFTLTNGSALVVDGGATAGRRFLSLSEEEALAAGFG